MKNKIQKNLLAGFIGLVVALLLFEIVLRIFGVVHTMQAETDVGQYARESQNLIICYGDSFTEGLGAPKGNGYPDVLQRLMKQNHADSIVVLNRGIAGSNSSQVLQRMKIDLAKVKPALVTIMTGMPNNWNLVGMPQTKTFWQSLRVVQFIELVVTKLQSGQEEKEEMLDQKAYDEAQAKFDAAIAQNPADGKAYYEMGYFFVNELKLEKAIEYFTKGTEQAPAYPNNYVGLYEVNKWLDRDDQSLAWIEEGIRNNPGFAYFHILAIQLYVGQGKEGLDKVLERAVAEAGQSRQLYGLLTQLRQSLPPGHEQEALIDSLLAHIDPNTLKDSPIPAVFYPGHAMYNPLKVDEEEYDKYIKWALGDLMEMVQLCKQNGITVLVMNYPVADPPRSKNLLPWARYISEAIREKALAEELDFLDITRVFDQLGPNKSQYQHTDYEDDHCNARGYAFIAERLYEHIINKGYLKTSHEQ